MAKSGDSNNGIELAREALQSLHDSERGDREVARSLGELAAALRESQSHASDSGGTAGKLAVTLLILVASGLASYTAITQTRSDAEEVRLQKSIDTVTANLAEASKQDTDLLSKFASLASEVASIKSAATSAVDELHEHGKDGHPAKVEATVQALQERAERIEQRTNKYLAETRVELKADIEANRETQIHDHDVLRDSTLASLKAFAELFNAKLTNVEQRLNQLEAAAARQN